MNNKLKKLSALWVFVSGCLWGSMGLFVRSLTSSGLSTFQVAGLRSIFTLIFLGLLLAIIDPSLFKIHLKDIWCFIGTGWLSITFFNCCYFYAINETSMAVAAILLYTAPVFVVLLSAVFFKEKITLKKIIALILCFIGCIFVTGLFSHSGSISPVGLLAGIGSGIGYALYSIFSREAINRGYKTLTIIFYTFLFSSLASLLIADMPSISLMIAKNEFPWLTVILQAIITTVLPYLLYTLGLRGTENGTASIIASIEPVVAMILGFAFFRETLSLVSASGIILVLCAIALLNIKGKGEQL